MELIVEWILKRQDEGLHWIYEYLAEDRDQ
jgi:hypothetical protein